MPSHKDVIIGFRFASAILIMIGFSFLVMGVLGGETLMIAGGAVSVVFGLLVLISTRGKID